MTVVRPHCQWGVAELDDDGRVAGFARKAALEHWINGGFFCFEPGPSTHLGRRQRARARAARALAADGQLARLPPRGLLGLHGHLQGRGRRSTTSGRRARRRGRSGSAGAEAGGRGAGHRRPRLRRRLALARALLERGDAVVVARPRRRRAAALGARACWGSTARSSWSRRPARRASWSTGAGRSARSTPSSTSPPRRSSAPSPTSPARDLRDQRARDLDAARGLPRGRGRRASSSPPPTRPTAPTTSCPTARTSRCARPRRTRPGRPPPT